MAVIFLKDGKEISPEIHLPGVAATFEWKNGQYWLHSDDPKEKPIGIEVDRILDRHLEFFRKSSVQKELFARAIGIKGAFRPKVLDLTGGLLGDTLLFLAAGCEVTTLERNPLVAFLIQSSLKNAQHPLISKLTFLESDALAFLKTSPSVDVIYFDPMFEDANSKASPKKEMRIFRELLEGDVDAEDTLSRALAVGVKRVVVKRPRLSRELLDKKPVRMEGKSTRYDVYFP
ncbi:MAG: class I SAM-dependent methyltransferase [Bacteriovoracaceae bacterium]